MEYWRKYGEGAGAAWKLAIWAAEQGDASAAWGSCPRADWLLMALSEGGAAARWRALCACDVARAGLAHIPKDLPQAVAVIRAAEAWALGEGSLERAVELAEQVRARASHLSTASRLAALAAAAPTDVAQGADGAEAAYAALAAGPDPAAVSRAHHHAAQLVLARRWPPTAPGLGIEAAEHRMQLAWEWLQQRVPIVDLSTVQVLVSYTVRWALVGAPADPDHGYERLHTAIAERIASARHPQRMLDDFLSFLDPSAPMPQLHPWGLQDQ